jgi:predicted MFS family arabinose efflux permease
VATKTAERVPERETEKRAIVPYLLVLASAVLCYAALGLVLRALPGYVNDTLHGGGVGVGLAVGAPALTGAALRPIGGRLADRHTSKPIMVIGSVIMTAGTFLALVTSLGALIASRLIVGAGEALMMGAGVRWLLQLAGQNRRGQALGHIGLANYAGLAIGPVLAEILGFSNESTALWLVAAGLPIAGAALAASITQDRAAPTPAQEALPTARLFQLTLRPGIGLLLVNVGYVALLAFGATVVTGHHLHLAALVIPIFGIGVIVSRTALARVPDKFGGRRTLLAAATTEAAGLIVLSFATSPALAVAALVVLAIGQGLAVPSLGLLALQGVPPGAQGAAAGLFFAYFDAGVGLGGPAVGLAAGAIDAAAALIFAGVAVFLAIPAALAAAPHRAR